MGTSITKRIKKASSLMTLESRLAKDGRTYESIGEFTNAVMDAWANRQLPDLRHIVAESPGSPELPTMVVDIGGVEYHLHGIAHGCHAFLSSGWHARRRVVDFVSNTMASYCRPSGNEDYLFEENLGSVFELDPAKQLRDVTEAKPRQPLTLAGAAKQAVYLLYVAPAVGAIHSGKQLIWYLCVRRWRQPPDERSNHLPYLAFKSLCDERYQATLSRYLLAQELPQPLDLEVDHVLERRSTMKSMSSAMDPFRCGATTAERSRWTASRLRHYTYWRGVRRLHYLCGHTHMSQIAFFLKNKEYEFAPLDQFAASFPLH